MQIILCATLQDGLTEIALNTGKNVYTVLANNSVVSYELIFVNTVAALLQSRERSLFVDRQLPRIIYCNEKIDLKMLPDNVGEENEFLLLSTEVFKTPDIPKNKNFENIKKNKPDSVRNDTMLTEYLAAEKIDLKATIRRKVLSIPSFVEQYLALEIIRLVPESADNYLNATRVIEETPLFWLGISEENLVQNLQSWFRAIKTEEETQLALSLMMTKAQKTSTEFTRTLISQLIQVDKRIKTGSKLGALTEYRRMLYCLLQEKD